MAKGIAGTCYLKVDGEQLSVSSNSISIQSAEVKREAVMGSTGLAGYSEVAVAPTISGTFNVTADFPLKKLLNGTEFTVTAELVTGKVYTLSDAFVSGDVSYKTGEGTIELTFTGVKGAWS